MQGFHSHAPPPWPWLEEPRSPRGFWGIHPGQGVGASRQGNRQGSRAWILPPLNMDLLVPILTFLNRAFTRVHRWDSLWLEVCLVSSLFLIPVWVPAPSLLREPSNQASRVHPLLRELLFLGWRMGKGLSLSRAGRGTGRARVSTSQSVQGPGWQRRPPGTARKGPRLAPQCRWSVRELRHPGQGLLGGAEGPCPDAQRP